MTQKTYPMASLRTWWKDYATVGYSVSALARKLGGSVTTWDHRIKRARSLLKVNEPNRTPDRKRVSDPGHAELRRTWAAYEAARWNESQAAASLGMPRQTLQKRIEICRMRLKCQEPWRNDAVTDALVRLLKRPGGARVVDVCMALAVNKAEARRRIERLAGQHFNIHLAGEHWSISGTPQTGVTTGREVVHTSDRDGRYRFGLVADSHIGSKYARLDVLNEIYDAFAAEGIERVYHCGNMIDGFKRGINDHDVVVAGMDDQVQLLAKEYPQRDGITTLAVAGDDHEGWFAQSMGIDIGKRIEQSMREAGRTDWTDLGYMECFVSLRHARSKAEAKLLVSHPGGGSAYADSYVVQKIIESFDGGEKPGIAAFGHYHKCLSGEYRNVWFCLVPCTQDQTPWARKKRLRYVIGGMIVEATQDEQGAIVRFKDEKLRFFNRGYYNDRWGHAGQVVLPARSR